MALLPELEAKTEFPTYFDTGPHWKAAWHRVAAHALLKKLERYVLR